MKYFVIGGAGAMGRITVKDMVSFSAREDEIIIADYDLAKAKELAASYRSPRVRAVRIDVRDRASAVRTLRGAFVVINSVQYQLNLEVMEAALAAKAHYIDLGGLFHMTRKQLELHDRFVKAGKVALVGMGAAPGITNLLSRMGCDRLDTVREIHTRVANTDQTKYSYQPALPVAYSLQTILEEFSLQPAVFTKGRFKFVEAMSGDTPERFPAPIGIKNPMYTLHSEVATLPLSFKYKGVRESSFKIAFDPDFLDRVKFLRDLGLASHEDRTVRGVKVKPIELVNQIAMSQKPPRHSGPLKQYEVVRAVVKGTRAGQKTTLVLDCHTRGIPAWKMGTDVNTGCPPAVAALMLARGEITRVGVHPPELAVPTEAFFRELKKRKMWVSVTKKKGWDQ